MSTIGHIDHSKVSLTAAITRYAEEHPRAFNIEGTRTGHIERPRAGIYIVRKTAYDAYRVFNVVTKEWVGNAVEDELTAKGIARNLNNPHV